MASVLPTWPLFGPDQARTVAATKNLVLPGLHAEYTSSMKPDSVATSWSDCFAMEINSDIDDGTQSNKVWAIAFWDDDVDADDGVNTVCNVVEGGCSFLPLSYLHAGVNIWSNSTAYPFEVWVRLVAH